MYSSEYGIKCSATAGRPTRKKFSVKALTSWGPSHEKRQLFIVVYSTKQNMGIDTGNVGRQPLRNTNLTILKHRTSFSLPPPTPGLPRAELQKDFFTCQSLTDIVRTPQLKHSVKRSVQSTIFVVLQIWP